MYSFLLEITTNERADIVNSLKQTHPKARTLIEEIENLEPHHGLVIEGPADIADQLRVVSSQGEPALPVFYVSGDGAKRRMQLGSSFDPKRVVHIASMVMRDAAVTSLARALGNPLTTFSRTSMMPTATILPSLSRRPLKRVARR